MLPLPESKRAAGRRIAEALLDPLARGVRAVTRRGPAQPEPEPPAAQPEPVPPTDSPPPDAAPPPPTGDEAAARIDAARARLRATIAAPTDDDPAPPPT